MDIRYSWTVFWSFLGLLVERLWNGFWPAATVLLLFVALALLNALTVFGNAMHIVFLLVFIAGFALSARRLGAPFRFPSRRDVERRIEAQSNLPHRPLAAVQDHPVEGLGTDALRLWQKHLEDAKKLWLKMKIYRPKSDVARQDTYALRHAAMVLFILGLAMAGNDALFRLAQGFRPDLGGWFKSAPVALDVWIEPPEYTREMPVFLASAQLGATVTTSPVAVPDGSLLKIRMSGYGSAPRVAYDGDVLDATQAAQKDYTVEFKLHASGDLSIRRWLVDKLGGWDIEVTPDQAPAIAIAYTDETARAALKIVYTAHDDYALKRVTGVVTLPPDPAQTGTPEPIVFNVPLSSSDKEERTHVVDLTSHPWAGLAARLTLEAEDDAGHVVISEPQDLVLPERIFTNPVAAAMITERKRLLRHTDPITQVIVINNLMGLANRPQGYKGDFVVFLGLDVALKRLAYEHETDSVQQLLWDLALRVEDGGLSQAARDLSDALQKLADALKDSKTTKEEVQQMLSQVQARMRDYVQALANEMQQRLGRGKNGQMPPPDLAEKLMQHIDLNQLLQQMQQLTQGGERDQMQKMAEYLKNAIDNLDPARLERMKEEQMKAMQSLQDMQDLVTRQQSLLDKTNKMQPGEKDKQAQDEQQAIRNKLGDAMRDLGGMVPNLPDSFAKADQAMKQSQEGLGKGQPKEAAESQKSALDELQKGMDKAMGQMAREMQQAILSFGLSPQSDSYGEGFDPLGRNMGKFSKGDVKIPDEKERRRVQEIIKELRDRSNDYQRPKIERDYIDRLLEQFD